MPSLKYRFAPTEPLAPLGFGSHKLDGVRLYFRGCNTFRQAIPLPWRGGRREPDGVVVAVLH